MKNQDRDAADFRSKYELKPECVQVRLTRTFFPVRGVKGGFFDVEISVLDREFTLLMDVCDALHLRGYTIILDGAGRNGIVVRKVGIRKPAGFVKIADLP